MHEHATRRSETDAPIPWTDCESVARAQALASRRPVMMHFSGSPQCRDSLAVEAVVFADTRVAAFIKTRVVPLHLDPARHLALVERYAVVRTPLVLLTDAEGHVYARIEGVLSPEEFRLRLALGVSAFECDEPAPPPELRVDAAPPARTDPEFAAETLYWHAASRFRSTGDRQRLRADWQMIATKFPRSVWALRMRLVDGTTRQAG